MPGVQKKISSILEHTQVHSRHFLVGLLLLTSASKHKLLKMKVEDMGLNIVLKSGVKKIIFVQYQDFSNKNLSDYLNLQPSRSDSQYSTVHYSTVQYRHSSSSPPSPITSVQYSTVHYLHLTLQCLHCTVQYST